MQYAAKAGSRQHDDVIEALPSNRSDESFDVGVLPRGARRRQDFLNAHGIHVIEHRITIAKERSRHFVPGERVTKLLHGPRGSDSRSNAVVRSLVCFTTAKALAPLHERRLI